MISKGTHYQSNFASMIFRVTFPCLNLFNFIQNLLKYRRAVLKPHDLRAGPEVISSQCRLHLIKSTNYFACTKVPSVLMTKILQWSNYQKKQREKREHLLVSERKNYFYVTSYNMQFESCWQVGRSVFRTGSCALLLPSFWAPPIKETGKLLFFRVRFLRMIRVFSLMEHLDLQEGRLT